MAEDDRTDAEGAASGNREGGLGVHVRGGGVQLGADAETVGQRGWCLMSQGRGVPERGQSGRKEPQIEQVTRLWRNLGVVYFRFGIMRVTYLSEKGCFSATC